MKYRRSGACGDLHACFHGVPSQCELNGWPRGPMNRLPIRLATSMAVGTLFYSPPAATQVAPMTQKATSVKITQGPEIERADSYLTIIRWTTNNPGGSPEHYGVVHYGTNPKELSQTAKSPIRLNPSHPDPVFRVRIDGLKSKTTYYSTVESMEANGKS